MSAEGVKTMVSEDIRRRAKHFVENETQFHLGFLPTEQSNPATANLSEVMNADVTKGIDMLLAVDAGMARRIKEVIAGGEFLAMRRSMVASVLAGGRIIFSGCGATGRLSILLDACWRDFWRRANEQPVLTKHFDLHEMEDRTFSVMTGGDRALIRSVENLEDYASLGAEQMREIGVSQYDTLVAITEGGETSSVLGTASYALEAGAKVFLAFNNPADLLASRIERSGKLINDPRVTVLDLCCGPMAVAGSTRMQATSIEQLVVICAMELALRDLLGAKLSPGELASLGFEEIGEHTFVKWFENTVEQLRSNNALDAISQAAMLEARTYEQGALVTYLANDYILDILTDTTERAPTFMLPPFRKSDDTLSPPSWAFVKNPRLDTPRAWEAMLRRAPRGIDWPAQMYREHGATEAMCKNPPRLSNEEILKYDIGNEKNASRWENANSTGVAVLVGEEVNTIGCNGSDFIRAMNSMMDDSCQTRVILAIGPKPTNAPSMVRAIHVECPLPKTALRIVEHLATKLVLNTISTSTMVLMGRVYGNWMAFAETSNKKLVDRSVRLIQQFTGLDYESACQELYITLDEIASKEPGAHQPIPPTVVTVERIKVRKQQT